MKKEHKAEYGTWCAMRRRCYDKSYKSYPNYGARGVRVCKAWRKSFAKFLEDMGERPEGHTIHRIDGTKGYYPDNCVWATRAEQNLKRRRWGKSRYRGVYKSGKGYTARVKLTVDGKTRLEYLGIYKTQIEAALAFDAYVVEHDLGRILNFPDPVREAA